MILGTINSGSQQQWYSRNVFMNEWQGGNWNMVFQGMSQNAPNNECRNKSTLYTTIENTPIIAEKPFISFKNDKYFLNIPPIEYNKIGPTNFYNLTNDIMQIDFENVYVADAQIDTASSINDKLDNG